MKVNNLILVILSLSLLVSCSKSIPNSRIRIGEQYGLAYAPLQIMKEKKFLEKLRPDTEIKWLKLGNTTAIREAVLSGDLDAGFMGIPPFLIATDKGMPWKIATGLSSSPLGLVVPKGRYSTIYDFTDEDKIALPQPGSIQHILLTMAAERELNDAKALDKNLISLKHPDGMNALIAGSISGHFTSPPYLFYEEDSDDFEILISGDEAMGEEFTFIVGAVTEEFYNNNRDLYNDYLRAIEQSIKFIQENRSETVEILSKVYSTDRGILEDQLYRPGMIFSTDIKGLDRFISFMKEQNYITSSLTSEGVTY